MARSGYLFNQTEIRDTSDHYGTSGTIVGAGSGEGGNPGGTAVGQLADSTVDFVNVGTEDIVVFSATNTLDQNVTLTYQGFIGTASEAELQTLDFGNISDPAFGGLAAPGGPDPSALTTPQFESMPIGYDGSTTDILRTQSAWTDPSALQNSDPSLPPEFLSRQDPLRANSADLPVGGVVDEPLNFLLNRDYQFALPGVDPQSLDNTVDFIGQDLPLRGDVVDARRNATTVQAGSALDIAYGEVLAAPFTVYQAPTVVSTGLSGSATDQAYTNSQGTAATFTLTYNGHVTDTITYSSDMGADIQAALEGLIDFAPGDVVVAKTSVTVYTVTFADAFSNVDAAAITITDTDPSGFVATGVTQTRQGGTLVDLTSAAAWENIAAPASVASGGGTGTVTVDPNTYMKIRVLAVAAGSPVSGALTLSWTSSRTLGIFAGIR